LEEKSPLCASGTQEAFFGQQSKQINTSKAAKHHIRMFFFRLPCNKKDGSITFSNNIEKKRMNKIKTCVEKVDVRE